MPRKAKRKRVYRTKEETKQRKKLKQKQRQKQEQNVNIKVGSSGSSSQPIPTVISNTSYVPQQQNNDNLLALLMKTIRQEQPVIKELPKTFRNVSVGEDVPIQSLSDQVQFSNDDQSISDNSNSTEAKIIDDEAYPIENNEQNITERLKTQVAIPILNIDEEDQIIFSRKDEVPKPDRSRDFLKASIMDIFGENKRGLQNYVNDYRDRKGITKPFSQWKKDDYEDMLSELISKN